jgi:uncharacterized membrane protein
MRPPDDTPAWDKAAAQRAADRIRALRDTLASDDIRAVIALSPEQQARFEEWSRAKLAALAQQFNIDTNASQKRVSWAMRIASTLGALALCAAVILLFTRYWGYFDTAIQVGILILMPLVFLACTECVAQRDRTPYFTGLLALVALASFILNLVAVGSVFNITTSERALLPWGVFAILLAYRYGLRLLLVPGLTFLMGYVAALYTARMGYRWLDFYERPDHFLWLGLFVFGLSLCWRHSRNVHFPAVYRLVGALTFFTAILSLAEWRATSYLPWKAINVERFYEIAGLMTSTAAIWYGILRNWNGLVNTGAAFFIIFLFTRLYHWWWDWMPRYLFFAAIGGLAIALVLVFRRVRNRMIHLENRVAE